MIRKFYYLFIFAIIFFLFVLSTFRILADDNPCNKVKEAKEFSLFTDPNCNIPYISFTSIPPIIDAIIDVCWSDDPVGSLTKVTFGSMPPDFGGSQWRAMYDNNNLYILMEIKDAVKVNDFDIWWQDDAVEVFIDGAHNGGLLYDGVNDFNFGFRWNDPSNIHIGTNSLNITTGILFVINDEPGGYNVEISIPWSTIGIVPLPGNQIGFDIAVNDDDGIGNADREAQITSFDDTGFAWMIPNLFGSVTLCTGAPDVTLEKAIVQADPTNSSPINFTATFSEPVSNFDVSDISLSGTAGATTAVISGSGPVYNIEVSGMTSDGTVIATINFGACNDFAGNLNLASVSIDNVVAYETMTPSVNIDLANGQSNPTYVSPVNFTASFSEVVSGFINTDVLLTGTAGASSIIISGGPRVYNMAVSGMTSDGTVIVNIPIAVANDTFGNPNTASLNIQNSIDFLTGNLTVNIYQSVAQADTTNTLPITFDVLFNNNVNDFSFDDISWIGSAAGITGDIAGNGAVYVINVTGIASNGSIIPQIGSGTVHDILNSPNTVSSYTGNIVVYDTIRPTIEITLAHFQQNRSNSEILSFNAIFSEPVSDFGILDIQLAGTSGATTVSSHGGPDNYTIDVSGMTNQGTVIVNIPANGAVDAAGNYNFASVNTENTIYFDNVKPNAEISSTVSNPNSLTEMSIIISFSEFVFDFDICDFNISNGSIQSIREIIQGRLFEATVIPGISGTIDIQLPSDVVIDSAGNYNNASNSFQIEYIWAETEFVANNIFSPNSSQNRYWLVKNIDQYLDYELIIRNLAGHIVYQTTNYHNDWDGKYKNKPLPWGTYYYYISSPDKKKIHKGFINIIYE